MSVDTRASGNVEYRRSEVLLTLSLLWWPPPAPIKRFGGHRRLVFCLTALGRPYAPPLDSGRMFDSNIPLGHPSGAPLLLGRTQGDEPRHPGPSEVTFGVASHPAQEG